MAFSETTIEEVLRAAEKEGAPQAVVCWVQGELQEVLHQYRRRMDRINRHTEVLDILKDCGFSVALAAERLEMSREGVYKHLRKSTETDFEVDTKAA